MKKVVSGDFILYAPDDFAPWNPRLPGDEMGSIYFLNQLNLTEDDMEYWKQRIAEGHKLVFYEYEQEDNTVYMQKDFLYHCRAIQSSLNNCGDTGTLPDIGVSICINKSSYNCHDPEQRAEYPRQVCAVIPVHPMNKAFKDKYEEALQMALDDSIASKMSSQYQAKYEKELQKEEEYLQKDLIDSESSQSYYKDGFYLLAPLHQVRRQIDLFVANLPITNMQRCVIAQHMNEMKNDDRDYAFYASVFIPSERTHGDEFTLDNMWEYSDKMQQQVIKAMDLIAPMAGAMAYKIYDGGREVTLGGKTGAAKPTKEKYILFSTAYIAKYYTTLDTPERQKKIEEAAEQISSIFTKLVEGFKYTVNPCDTPSTMRAKPPLNTYLEQAKTSKKRALESTSSTELSGSDTSTIQLADIEGTIHRGTIDMYARPPLNTYIEQHKNSKKRVLESTPSTEFSVSGAAQVHTLGTHQHGYPPKVL